MALSNFYRDYSFTENDFDTIIQIYQDLMVEINNYAKQIKNNAIVPKVETYRFLPMQRLNIREGMYSLNAVLENINSIKKLGLSGISLQDRINMWNNDTITDEQKIEILNFLGNYVQLSTKRGFDGEREYNIVDLALTQGQNPLIRNYDYYLKNNKIFLLRNTGNASITTDKDFSLRNISIDYNTSEELLGKDVKVAYTNALTKNEYTELVKMLIYASLGGPTVSNLQSAISSITGFSGVNIYDRYVRDINKQREWTNPGSLIHDFDFIVSMPAEYTVQTDKVNIVLNYIKMIKPAYSDFTVLTNSFYEESLNYSVKSTDLYSMDKIKEMLIDVFSFATRIEPYDWSKIKETIAENRFKMSAELYNLDKVIAIPDYDILLTARFNDSSTQEKVSEILLDNYLHNKWDDPLYFFKMVENNIEATYNRNDDIYMLDNVVNIETDEKKSKTLELADPTVKIKDTVIENYTLQKNEAYVSSTAITVLTSFINGDTVLNDSFDTMNFDPIQTFNY